MKITPELRFVRRNIDGWDEAGRKRINRQTLILQQWFEYEFQEAIANNAYGKWVDVPMEE